MVISCFIPAEKMYINAHRICNGFNGHNGNCFSFNGNCNVPVGLIMCCLHLVAC